MKTYAMFPGLEAIMQRPSKTRRWLAIPKVGETLREASQYLSEMTGQPEDIEGFLLSHTRPFNVDLDRTFIALTAMQVGIYRQVSEKVQVEGLVGCSVGDIARLAVSEVISLRDALEIIWLCTSHRHLCPDGRMVDLRPREVAFTESQLEWLTRLDMSVSIWSNKHATLSGTVREIEDVVGRAAGLNLRTRPLYDFAFHSKVMLPVEQEIRKKASRWKANPAVIPVFSSVLLRHLETAHDMSTEAFAGACQQVNWRQALHSLVEDHLVTRFLNVGPSDTLIRWALQNDAACAVPVLDSWTICSDSASSPRLAPT